jgi:hypothetical protein
MILATGTSAIGPPRTRTRPTPSAASRSPALGSRGSLRPVRVTLGTGTSEWRPASAAGRSRSARRTITASPHRRARAIETGSTRRTPVAAIRPRLVRAQTLVFRGAGQHPSCPGAWHLPSRLTKARVSAPRPVVAELAAFAGRAPCTSRTTWSPRSRPAASVSSAGASPPIAVPAIGLIALLALRARREVDHVVEVATLLRPLRRALTLDHADETNLPYPPPHDIQRLHQTRETITRDLQRFAHALGFGPRSQIDRLSRFGAGRLAAFLAGRRRLVRRGLCFGGLAPRRLCG